MWPLKLLLAAYSHNTIIVTKGRAKLTVLRGCERNIHDAGDAHFLFFYFCFSAKCGYVWLSAHIYGSKLSNVRHFSSRMYSYMIAAKSCLNGSQLIRSSYKRLVAQVELILRKLQVPFIQIGGSYFQYGVPWWWLSRCFGERPLVNMLGTHPHPHLKSSNVVLIKQCSRYNSMSDGPRGLGQRWVHASFTSLRKEEEYNLHGWRYVALNAKHHCFHMV